MTAARAALLCVVMLHACLANALLLPPPRGAPTRHAAAPRRTAMPAMIEPFDQKMAAAQKELAEAQAVAQKAAAAQAAQEKEVGAKAAAAEAAKKELEAA
eukprot:1675545-Prymnesium_polylepis.1